MTKRHVVKFDYHDGEKRLLPLFWCGKVPQYREFWFIDAQHVALAVEGSVPPCKNCIKAIIKELEKELQA